ncbi:MAG: hydroxymethylglutaryl-CoA reductase [Spirochaetia bacterium]|nr:hydroxymethylglutaryl-CoA reductase [Spirochaetia bacterium]
MPEKKSCCKEIALSEFANIPMRTIGPVRIKGVLDEDIHVPLATLETPLWPSVSRGALISRLAGGITTTMIDSRMTRSIILEAPDAASAYRAAEEICRERELLEQAVSESSRFARLLDVNYQIVSNLIYLRLEFFTGDAAGHNMATKCADSIFSIILEHHSELSYCSISGNYCCDKKVSAVNGILGRGRNVIAEITISEDICREYLHTTPAAMADINTKKNLIGSILAGSIRSANAHYANMLLAFYLATGQDCANIVEGSQGITFAEVKDGALRFSCTIPNIIAGTVGNGKTAEFAAENLKKLGCTEDRAPGENSNRLAAICAATVLCGELSLLAAEANQGELMKAHLRIERRTR